MLEPVVTRVDPGIVVVDPVYVCPGIVVTPITGFVDATARADTLKLVLKPPFSRALAAPTKNVATGAWSLTSTWSLRPA
jgi:hypothetical protein